MSVWNERRLHVKNTRDRGHKGIDFWMYQPKDPEGYTCICGICRGDIKDYKHCPRCYPDKKDDEGFTTAFNVIVKPGQTELLKEFNEAD